MNELLQQLSEAVGVSGEEGDIRLLIRNLIADYVDEWRVDAVGNLLALKRGDGRSDLRVMVDAHMDEVGLMITNVDSMGTARFEKVGGLDDRMLLGKVVQVGPKKLTGVIGARPVHLLNTAIERSQVVKASAMRIDVGASSKDEGQGKMKVGDRATFLTPYQEYGDIAMGKALDNRAGCAILIELLRGERFPFDLHAAFTVQEEVGMAGAHVASFTIEPDVALVLECTPAYDLPIERDISPNVALGRGPSIYVMDSRTIQDPRLVSHILRMADELGIPFQIRQPGGGGTNTGAIQRAGVGMPAATIAVPGRYLHAPASMINLSDYAHARQLADATLRALTRDLLVR